MNNPQFSIIIVSYNVWDYLHKCLTSLYQQTFTDFKVIVVDNNSTDNTTGNIAQLFPGVVVISNKNNAGFSAANNQGIKIAKGENLFLLNPDTELNDASVLANLKKNIDIETDADAFCPRLINSDNTVQLSCWKFIKLSDLMLELFYLHRFQGTQNIFAPSDKSFVEAASGAALIFRRSLVDEIGLLDENLFWTEDTDYCYRINKAGKKLLYLPDVQIVHHVGKSASKNNKVAIPNQLLSKLKFFKKNYSLINFMVADMLILLFIVTRLLTFATLTPFGKAFNQKRSAYWAAFKKYWRYNLKKDYSIAT